MHDETCIYIMNWIDFEACLLLISKHLGFILCANVSVDYSDYNIFICLISNGRLFPLGWSGTRSPLSCRSGSSESFRICGIGKRCPHHLFHRGEDSRYCLSPFALPTL